MVRIKGRLDKHRSGPLPAGGFHPRGMPVHCKSLLIDRGAWNRIQRARPHPSSLHPSTPP